jgi:hypothetical protein
LSTPACKLGRLEDTYLLLQRMHDVDRKIKILVLSER